MAPQIPQLPAYEDAEEQLILGRYRVLAEAGAGGFGSVQLAWDTRMQRRVAVKVIDLTYVAEEQGLVLDNVNDLPSDAFTGLDEARTAAMLNNANIVTVHDFEVQDNFAYIIMEYVDGMTLTQLMRVAGDNITGVKFMKENDIVDVVVDASTETILFAEMPVKTVLKVTYTEPGEKGNTATNALKEATVETGAMVRVPLFINTDDLIRVDTRTGEYCERVKA